MYAADDLLGLQTHKLALLMILASRFSTSVKNLLAQYGQKNQ